MAWFCEVMSYFSEEANEVWPGVTSEEGKIRARGRSLEGRNHLGRSHLGRDNRSRQPPSISSSSHDRVPAYPIDDSSTRQVLVDNDVVARSSHFSTSAQAISSEVRPIHPAHDRRRRTSNIDIHRGTATHGEKLRMVGLDDDPDWLCINIPAGLGFVATLLKSGCHLLTSFL